MFATCSVRAACGWGYAQLLESVKPLRQVDVSTAGMEVGSSSASGARVLNL